MNVETLKKISCLDKVASAGLRHGSSNRGAGRWSYWASVPSVNGTGMLKRSQSITGVPWHVTQDLVRKGVEGPERNPITFGLAGAAALAPAALTAPYWGPALSSAVPALAASGAATAAAAAARAPSVARQLPRLPGMAWRLWRWGGSRLGASLVQAAKTARHPSRLPETIRSIADAFKARPIESALSTYSTARAAEQIVHDIHRHIWPTLKPVASKAGDALKEGYEDLKLQMRIAKYKNEMDRSARLGDRVGYENSKDALIKAKNGMVDKAIARATNTVNTAFTAVKNLKMQSAVNRALREANAVGSDVDAALDQANDTVNNVVEKKVEKVRHKSDVGITRGVNLVEAGSAAIDEDSSAKEKAYKAYCAARGVKPIELVNDDLHVTEPFFKTILNTLIAGSRIGGGVVSGYESARSASRDGTPLVKSVLRTARRGLSAYYRDWLDARDAVDLQADVDREAGDVSETAKAVADGAKAVVGGAKAVANAGRHVGHLRKGEREQARATTADEAKPRQAKGR